MKSFPPFAGPRVDHPQVARRINAKVVIECRQSEFAGDHVQRLEPFGVFGRI